MIARTSQLALASTDTDAQRMEVLRVVKRYAYSESIAMTAAELSQHSTLDSYAFNRRLPELKERGQVDNSGTRKEGRMCFKKGTKCMTWWFCG